MVWTPNKIKLLRSALGALTQEEFAQKLGVTFATVNRWEKGRRAPSTLAQRILKYWWGTTYLNQKKIT